MLSVELLKPWVPLGTLVHLQLDQSRLQSIMASQGHQVEIRTSFTGDNQARCDIDSIMGIIYMAHHSESGRNYVGSSFKHLEVRKHAHINKARSCRSGNKFYDALRGNEQKFHWSVLETVDTNDRSVLRQTEQKWITEMNAIDLGFNMNCSHKINSAPNTDQSIMENFMSIRKDFQQILICPQDIQNSLLIEMFVKFARNPREIHTRLENRRAEKLPPTGSETRRVHTMRQITGWLGIDGSWAIGAQIERSVMEKSMEKVLAMRNELREVFDLRLRETKRRDSLKRGLELVNGIFNRFGFTQIQAEGPRKRQRMNGRRQTTNGFAVKETEQYRGFGEHTRD